MNKLEKEVQDRMLEILSDEENKKMIKKHMYLEMIGYPHAIHTSSDGKLKIVEVISDQNKYYREVVLPSLDNF